MTEDQIKIYLSDTLKHVRLVREKIGEIVYELEKRGRLHDQSKFEEPEFSGYVGLSEAVKGLQYGSMAYRMAFAPYKEVIQHHYDNNDHHPEFSEGRFDMMDLLQIMEMICDWKAASMRSSETLLDTLETTITRFNIDETLAHIIRNTVTTMEW